MKMPDWSDALVFLGAAAAVYGVSLIYIPAAWIVGGLILVGLGAIADVLPLKKPQNPEAR